MQHLRGIAAQQCVGAKHAAQPAHHVGGSKTVPDHVADPDAQSGPVANPSRRAPITDVADQYGGVSQIGWSDYLTAMEALSSGIPVVAGSGGACSWRCVS